MDHLSVWETQMSQKTQSPERYGQEKQTAVPPCHPPNSFIQNIEDRMAPQKILRDIFDYPPGQIDLPKILQRLWYIQVKINPNTKCWGLGLQGVRMEWPQSGISPKACAAFHPVGPKPVTLAKTFRQIQRVTCSDISD